MHCKIAGLTTEIPTADGMALRCREYWCEEVERPDITIRAEAYRPDEWPGMGPEGVAYMESGIQFYSYLLRHNGMMLHASAVELDGNAYLFSGSCGVGKSTHTRLWQEAFGVSARIFNDDKPALRYLDGRWKAYGTPWCGKDGINRNISAPLAGICFMKQAEHNRIRRLTAQEAVVRVLEQTLYRLYPAEMHLLLNLLDRLVQDIPIYELENRPEPEAAWLSFETMRCGAKEAGL